MSEADFSLPTQYKVEYVSIDGIDVVGLFQSIEIFENIYSTGVTGSIVIADSAFAGFVEKEELEFVEAISFAFTNGLGDELAFDGYLCGLRDEIAKQRLKIYTIDFCSQAVRNDDETFIVRRFEDESPQEIVDQMIDIVAQEGEEGERELLSDGPPMNFIGSRRKPTQIMRYVCNNGVADPEADATQDESENQEGEVKGAGGFLCWETLKGYRFVSVKEIRDLSNGASGYPFVVHEDYEYTLANNESGIERMKHIIEYEFPKLADYDEKRKSGALNHIQIVYDMDKGEYKEYSSVADAGAKETTEKQADLNKVPTRIKTMFCQNERYNKKDKCDKEKDLQFDQKPLTEAQGLKTQNTFDDQHGRFTLPPQFNINAGDAIDVLIRKTILGSGEEGEDTTYDKKHSGAYVIQQVGHHIFADGQAYTKLQTLRSLANQSDDSTETPEVRPENQPIPSPFRRPLPNSPTSAARGNKILYGISS